ncbi:hypothetical protein J4416_02110 [Candidatus Pacearchaeota archaeon]|nr:hypothetical protein [Candidatus Pacearchaeota archaeon]
MIKHTFASSIIILVILSTFALAAGTSTGNSRNASVVSVEVDEVPAVSVNTCEDKADVRSRIKCRFENTVVAKREAVEFVEEACRDSQGEKREACNQLYKRSKACYNNSDAIAKKRCFLEKSGININRGGTFRAAPDESKRNYVILLLYNLQEKIEGMQENGNITTDQATSLVTKIVEIKKMILSGAKRSEIVPKMQEFKKEFRLVISSLKGDSAQ